jgi:hypothetical protein
MWLQDVAEGVAKQISGHDRQGDRYPGKKHQPLLLTPQTNATPLPRRVDVTLTYWELPNMSI